MFYKLLNKQKTFTFYRIFISILILASSIMSFYIVFLNPDFDSEISSNFNNISLNIIFPMSALTFAIFSLNINSNRNKSKRKNLILNYFISILLLITMWIFANIALTYYEVFKFHIFFQKLFTFLQILLMINVITSTLVILINYYDIK